VYEHTSNILSLLDGVIKTHNGWDAKCPCRNDDSNPSLSVHEKPTGQILMYCHRGGGCNASQICDSIGVALSDLMPPSELAHGIDEYPTARPSTSYGGGKPKKKLRLVAEYNYLDEDGTLAFQKRRFVDEDGRKTFRQRRPSEDGGWISYLGDIPKILYNLPQVLKAKADGEEIWVVEGEKDADTLTSLGVVATTMPNGAGGWLDIHTETLAGATVLVIADNDEAGRQHAAYVLEELTKVGCDVQAYSTPRCKDISDFIADGGDTMELVRFIPEGEDLLPVLPQEHLDDEDDNWEEEERKVPRNDSDSTIEKIRELLDNKSLSPSALLTKASFLISSATVQMPSSQGRLVNWDNFISESDVDNYDWLIPGLLERRERVIVVASEGVGKTMLARQVAITTACGVQPFSFQRMPPITTLTVDLENPERIIRRSSRTIMNASKSLGFCLEPRAHLLIKPDGLNLLDSADRLLLEANLEQIKPDLLILGPLYKAFLDPGNKTSEAVTIEVVRYLDSIRMYFNCALWLEHHAPLGESQTSRNLRPFGSAVWSRWPEFGLSLQPDPTAVGEYVYDVKHFRGERDERLWPLKMKRGKSGKWPFETIEFKKVGDGGA
jgi:5S rRNA maturation endonuclease (ribonuclease M5)